MKALIGLDELAASTRQDVLSVTLNVDLTVPDHQRGNPAYRIWLRRELDAIMERVPRERRAEAAELVDRVLTRVSEHRHGRGLALFAAPALWREYVFPFPLVNTAHYGRPNLVPVLWAIDEYEPYGVFAVDREHARLSVTFLGATAVVEQEILVLDTRSWRVTSGRQPTFARRTGTGAGRGAQRDTFDARVDAQLHRFWRHAAAVAVQTCRELAVSRLIVAGPDDATAAMATLIGDHRGVQVVATVPAPPDLTLTELTARTLPVALAEERRREYALVADLVEQAAGRGRGVVGMTATLGALRRGEAKTVVVDTHSDPPVWVCTECGDASIERQSSCAVCGGTVEQTSRLSVLPLFARRKGTELEFVNGAAADLLKSHEGIGALLRYSHLRRS